MPQLSLRAKLLVGFVLVLLPMLGPVLYGFREANERRIQTSLDTQTQTAQSVAALVDTTFDESFTLAWSLANDPIVRALDPSLIDPHLEEFALCCPQFEAIGVINVRRVLITLLDNAIRFSPQGGRIEVTVVAQEDMALVSIHDYGLGISEERQRHVFEPSYEPYPAGTPGLRRSDRSRTVRC